METEYFFLSLVIHMGQDNFQGPLRQWFDLALWVHRNELNWDEILERAQDWKVSGLLAATVMRLRFLGIHRPGMEDVLSRNGPVMGRYLSFWMTRDALTPLPHRHSSRVGQLALAIPCLDTGAKRIEWVERYLRLRFADWMANRGR